LTVIATEIELEPLEDGELADHPPLATSPWPFLGAVKVKVSVRVGGAEISVARLLELRAGAVLELDRLVEEPLDVLVDEHVVARGVLVAVGDNFGVRITEAATTATRMAK
jgi:flagellar motor switch protein FliN